MAHEYLSPEASGFAGMANLPLMVERDALPADMDGPLRRLEMLLSRFTGTPIRKEPADARSRFLGIPYGMQEQIVSGWKSQADFIEGAIDEGLDAFDEKGMLRYAFEKLNLISDAGLFETIEVGDVMEILNQDHVQVYRSFSYFALCNYSLLELSSYAWYELYERSSLVTKQLMEAGKTLLSGNVTRVDLSHIPEYTLRERMTPSQDVFNIREKFGVLLLSPLSDDSYALSVKRVRELAAQVSLSTKVRFI